MSGFEASSFNVSCALVLPLLLSACGGQTGPKTEPPDEVYTVYDGAEIIQLSSKMVSCSYMSFAQYIVVEGCFASETPETRNRFYGQMGDFKPEWGVAYELSVEYWKAAYEIADAPNYITKLVEIIYSQEDPAGTRYEYERMRIDYTFDSRGYFLGEPWGCGLDDGCEWILTLGAELINLTFEKQANGTMRLIEATI